jgi:hypothetical protein
MRGTGRILLALVFVAVLVMWAWSSPHPTALVAVKASVTPIDMMEKVGQDLRDETPREPF